MDCHPDKNPDNPKAAELFHELSTALELLTDEKARSTYDKYQQAKKAAQLRNDQLDLKRRKLKSDLEARERGVYIPTEDISNQSFGNVEEQLKAEIDRLRKEGSRLLEEEQRLMKEQLKQTTTAIPVATPTRIKAKWKADKDDNGGYSAENLRKFLGKYGDITELVLLPGKKGSALIEFSSRDAAEMAVAYEKGDLANPLKLSYLPGHEPKKAQNPIIPAHTTTTVTDNDFESLVLRNLRQAEERKRLIEQMEKEEAQES